MGRGRKKVTYRDGEERRAHADKQHRRAQRAAARKLNAQEKQANIRAKYGPLGRPAPVVVKNLASDARNA